MKVLKRFLIVCISSFLLTQMMGCATRITGKCPAPPEYRNKAVATIFQEAFETVKRPGEKRAISYGLYGSKEIFLQGIRESMIQARDMYPGWDIVIYADPKTVPAEFIAEMKANGAIVREDPSYNNMFARFYIVDDVYDRFIVRDADSRFYPREVAAVADWMDHPSAWLHGMRDAASASYPLQGGMWGGMTKPLREALTKKWGPNSKIADLTKDFLNGRKPIWGDDQDFLTKYFVGAVGDDHVMSHESVDCNAFPGSRGFPVPKGISDQHIGTRIKP